MRKKAEKKPISEESKDSSRTYRKSLKIYREDYIPVITGQGNRNFEAIQKAFNKRIEFAIGKKRIDVHAADDDTATRAISILRALQSLQKNEKGKSLSEEEVRMAIRKALPKSTTESSPSGHSPIEGYPVTPRRPKQAEYMDALAKHPLVFGTGPAGTGKTFLAIAMAVRALTSGLVKKIFLTRPLKETDEELGTVPGGPEEKMHERLIPLLESLKKIMGQGKYEQAKKAGQIEIIPLGQARGRTLENAFIVVDEAQNTTKEQMKMILTRIGEPATMAVNGDVTQCDLPRNWNTGKQLPSGLNDAINVLSDHFASGAFALVAFGEEDVVRSHTAKLIVQSYGARDKREQAASGTQPEPS